MTGFQRAYKQWCNDSISCT